MNNMIELRERHKELINKKNYKLETFNNGLYSRYANPVLTKDHVPLNWRFDMSLNTNPLQLERISYNSVFNPGALFYNDKFYLLARVELSDRKSIFALSSSKTGIDNFHFESPIIIEPLSSSETNYYDMRLVLHEDSYIYGVFCVESSDYENTGDLYSAVAQCGIVRTTDLNNWERLPNILTKSPQQRNCDLHPEFVNGKYAFYTRPQDDFISAGKGGGIGWGLCDSIENPKIENEVIIDHRSYHSINEAKNGLGPSPIKTASGWLHLAHGVRNTAAGLRYVLYLFMTELGQPWVKIRDITGAFMSPEYHERSGDVDNVLFSNGWIKKDDHVFIYYASSDTRCHVVTSKLENLVDHVLNAPEQSGSSYLSTLKVIDLIEKNKSIS